MKSDYFEEYKIDLVIWLNGIINPCGLFNAVRDQT